MTAPLPPYAELLGISRSEAGGASVWTMPFAESVVGRPGYVHGGAIAALLEFAALGAITDAAGAAMRLKPIDVAVDYLRGATECDTFADAVVNRLGHRVANVAATAWQEDRAVPIAIARMNVLVKRG